MSAALLETTWPAWEPVRTDEPATALLHLPVETPPQATDAAGAIYRQARQGRRVVAVAYGSLAADALLAGACERIGLEVARSEGSTLIREPVVIVHGVGGAERARASEPQRRLRVALAGCGVVGGGLLERLERDTRVDLVGVLVRDPKKRREPALARQYVVRDAGALLAREPDVLIDALSNAPTALHLIRAALERGVHVISAGKQAVGADLAGLKALARAHGGSLRFSAAVGGGAPMLETVRRALAHAPVVRIEAVLNGTCNFILNRLAAGDGYRTALKAAQDAGFAEADPSADVEGRDALAKLTILAEAAFGRALPEIEPEPLRPDFRPDGVTRQIARASANGRGAIRLEGVGDDPLFADLPDEWNALRVTTADGRVFICKGRGAGRWPTAESVWADLEEVLAAV